MALKRPSEVSWNFRKPPEPFPQTPGANGCFLAPSGMGKTTTLISMLLGPYRAVFDEVHIFSPSVHIDSAWGPVKDFAGHLEKSSFNDEWDEEALRSILDRQRERIRELKSAKSKKPLPQILTILDDFADRSDVLHSRSGILTTLFIRGRHFGSSCWVSSQKLTAIASVARVNFRFLLVWRLRNQKEIVALMEELSAIYPMQTLHQMYEAAITDEDHSFWYINLVAKRKEDMFFVRFDHKLVLE
jgi:hypothetical protein